MYIIAVDLGAESGRVVLGSYSGEKLDLEVLHRFSNISVTLNGRVTWDAPNIFHNILLGLKMAVKRVGNEKISSIGIDTWGVDFGILDKLGNLVSLPTHYRDSYTDGVSDKIAEAVGKERLYARTGIAVWPFNTINQLYALRQEDALALREGEELLFMPDLLNYWLCGVKKNEKSIASTSQCLDIEGNSYADDVLQELGIDGKIFSDIVDTGTILGNISPEILREIGVDYDIKVIATASHDTAAAVVATPFDDPENAAFLSCGTWSLLGVERDEPLTTERARELNFTNERGIDNTYRVLRNVMGLWMVQRAKADFEREGLDYTYAELAEMAKSVENIGESLIDPNDLRFFAPINMVKEIKGYCKETGQRIPQSVSEVMCVILMSLACAYRFAIESLEEMTGNEIEYLHIIGGGSQNTTLCQWTKNITDRIVTAGPVEGTGMGNILVQLKSLEQVSDTETLREIVKRSCDIITYEKNEDFDYIYTQYLKVTQ